MWHNMACVFTLQSVTKRSKKTSEAKTSAYRLSGIAYSGKTMFHAAVSTVRAPDGTGGAVIVHNKTPRNVTNIVETDCA